MKRVLASVRALLGLLALVAGACASADTIVPQRQFLDSAIAFLQVVPPNGTLVRGSAVVARDRRLVYTAAHLLFDGARWASVFRVVPGWDAATTPDVALGVVPRGFRHFAGYADTALVHGGNAPATFDLDFAVFYAATSFGTPLSTLADSGARLRDAGVQKRIAGYPVVFDADGTAGFAFQHATPAFGLAATRSLGAYHLFNGVSTGPGNSGGPVFVEDAGGALRVGGILLSGTAASAGVYALDADAEALAGDALGDVVTVGSRAFANKVALRLPDNQATYRERAVTVRGFTGALRSLALTLSIDTPRRGDLDAYLVSPAGRVQWVLRHRAGTDGAVHLTRQVYTARYAGQAANGKWRLRMRDLRAGATATFRAVTLTVAAPLD